MLTNKLWYDIIALSTEREINKMYKIIYWNYSNHIQYAWYGFSKMTLDRLRFLIHNNDNYEICFVLKLVWNLKTFKKCLKNKEEVLKIK